MPSSISISVAFSPLALLFCPFLAELPDGSYRTQRPAQDDSAKADAEHQRIGISRILEG